MYRKMLFIALAVLISGQVHSATLNITGGQLFGASGVNVGGSLFDVEFVDGTCIALFDGCDSAVDDFTFPSLASAQAANTALLDQVFGPGGFSVLDPSLINGLDIPAPPPGQCGSGVSGNCPLNNIFTPYDLGLIQTIPAVFASPIFIFNDMGSYIALMGGGGNSVAIDTDLTSVPNSVYARWTPAPVPIPASIWLFGTALLGFIGVSRRRVVA